MLFESITIGIISLIGSIYAYNMKKAENEEKKEDIIINTDIRQVKTVALYQKNPNGFEEVPLYDNIELAEFL